MDASELGKLNARGINELMENGITRFASIVNTADCRSSGKHWVAIFVDIKENQIDLFNSTPDYRKELKIVEAFCKQIGTAVELNTGKKAKFEFTNGDIKV